MEAIHRRFKLLYFLYQELGDVLSESLEELANRIDDNDPQAEEALTYFENQVINILES